jgi:hypothetical protein
VKLKKDYIAPLFVPSIISSILIIIIIINMMLMRSISQEEQQQQRPFSLTSSARFWRYSTPAPARRKSIDRSIVIWLAISHTSGAQARIE